MNRALEPESKAYVTRIAELRPLGRPLICTECMARGNESTFDTILQIGKRQHIGAINWGFVAGRTQNNLPWDSWKRPYVTEQSTVWFHEIFRNDGRPYRQREIDLNRQLTGRGFANPDVKSQSNSAPE